MAENSKIEWTDHTFNPWIGCTKVSPGCDHCYAEAWDRRFAVSGHAMRWGAGVFRTRTSATYWRLPLQWNAQAEREGRRFRVFCASLADVFDNEVPATWRVDLFNLILSTPSLDWLLLTKRISNAARMIDEALPDNMKALPPDSPVARPWPNVWLGATVVNQEEADRDIPKLLATPASVRFLSMEPLLGPVDITPFLWGKHEAVDTICQNCPRDGDCECGYHTRTAMKMPALDWVIVGGESGPHARPMHPDWARDLRDQCTAAGVAFHFKQWGEWTPGENVARKSGVVDGAWWVDGRWMPSRENLAQTDGHRDDEPDLYRVGKKAAGRLLDGRTWDDLPV